MPSLLDSNTIAIALEALPGWQALDDQLVRTVQVPAGIDALLRSVRQLAQDMDHPADAQVDGAAVTIRLSTSSVGGVSELDVDLAARIDQVLSGSEATGTDPAHR